MSRLKQEVTPARCKQEHYDQDVIKSYSSYIYQTPARKIPRLTGSPPFLQNPPSS